MTAKTQTEYPASPSPQSPPVSTEAWTLTEHGGIDLMGSGPNYYPSREMAQILIDAHNTDVAKKDERIRELEKRATEAEEYRDSFRDGLHAMNLQHERHRDQMGCKGRELSTVIEEWRQRLAELEKDSVEAVLQNELRCTDCGTPYAVLGLDLVLPDQQWKAIFREERGVLCANCICLRARNRGATVLLAWIDNIVHNDQE